jgi:glycosyltransferase involved in cell wall biosynthesis
MDEPSITVVVATYDRPDALVAAIRGAQLQTVSNWRMLVVGDACGQGTADAIARLDDERVSYVNLAARCGEQGGPNSVGMRLAQTDYIAFLNHDDVWLPEHLADALEALATSHASLYVARSAFAHATVETPDGRQRPGFSEVSPADRTLAQAFDWAFFLFEPASSWVMRHELAVEVGDWHPSRELHRTPLVDWLLRAWRAGATLVTGDEIGVLKLNVHHQHRDGPLYGWGSKEQDWCVDRLTADGSDAVLRIVHDDLARARERRWPVRDWTTDTRGADARWQRLRERLVTEATAEVFFETGWDVFNTACELAERESGAELAKVLHERTGDVITSAPPFADLAADAAFQLSRR